jgi:chorismate mutase
MKEELQLNNIRSNLIRQEETIIFSLIERAQFGKNLIIYKKNGVPIAGDDSPFMYYLLKGTEKLHALVRRYTAPDEHPFTKDLPEPILSPMEYEWPIKKTDVNLNDKILNNYINEIIPLICQKEDDDNYGSSSVNDINALQAISKRIHYGKYVAESKFLSDVEGYKKLILEKKEKEIMGKLTNKTVEKKILERVELKASTYGQEPDTDNPIYKIQPAIIKKIYEDFIIPFTKEVELLYLLQRI